MDRIVISSFTTGFETDRIPPLLPNDAFPLLENAYPFRGRVQKKRGTTLLGRLRRDLDDQSLGNVGNGVDTQFVLDTFTLLSISGSYVPGSIEITIAAPGTATFTDNGDGTFSVTGSGDAGTSSINYETGFITLGFNAAIAASAATITFGFYPNLPVMGLRDFETTEINFPTLLSFDTQKAYEFNQSTNIFFDVSFYKDESAPLKASPTPFSWSGQDYQQFWTTNYQGALWATNSKSGFHFVEGAYSAGTGTPAITFILTKNGPAFTTLVNGDKLWFNEWSGGSTINGLVGTVTDDSGSAAGTYIVTFSVAQTVAGTGIVQLLTNSITSPAQDGIKWYDGSSAGEGWVNFSPPLSDDANPSYLVGALMILAFKDRLLFFAPTTQTSTGATVFHQDMVIYSQNGTVYYNSFVPSGQTFNTESFYFNVVGRGGFERAGIAQQILTVGQNEDVLIVGFEDRQTKLIYTSNDIRPFIFYSINTEYGSECTFSTINLDEGCLTVGDYGILETTQNEAARIDLKIPDQIFNIQNNNNGLERVHSARDFRQELVYFSYPDSSSPWVFPNRSFVYSYRERNWGIFKENYTSHGTFRRQESYTWATLPFRTWAEWTVPWISGRLSSRYPDICAGNQQGFVLLLDQGTAEAASGYIQAISSNTITSPNHNLDSGDYLFFLTCQGTTLTGQIRQVTLTTNKDTFTIDGVAVAGTYIGGGEFIRLANFRILTKQFPVYWQEARKVRVGTQRYLLESTSNGQCTSNIYLNQDNSEVVTQGPLFPDSDTSNSSLIYTNIVLTSPEPNSGLNTGSTRLWHRVSQSAIGDTFQLELTLSDAQMRETTRVIQNSDFILHAIVIDVYPSGVLI